MNAIPSRQDEYEDQAIGLSASELMNEVRNITIQEFKAGSQKIREPLINLQTTQEGREAVDNAVSAIVDKCIELSKGPLEELSEKLSGVFSIPPHVLLPEDEVQRQRYTQEDEENERAALTQLASRYRRVTYLQALYQKEIEKWEELEYECKLFDVKFSEIQKLEADMKNDSSSSEFCKIVESVLGLEVEDASLKPTGCQPSEENHKASKVSILETYKQ